MFCRQYSELIYLYADGEINKEQLDKLKKHIKKCSGCEKRYKKVINLSLSMTSLFNEISVPNENFSKEVMKEISQRKEAKVQRKRHIYRRIPICSAILIIIIMFFFNKDFIATATQEWVKILNFKSHGMDYDISASNAHLNQDYDSQEKREYKVEDPNRYFKDLTSKKTIYDRKEAEKLLETKFLIPPYIPRNYKFAWLEQGTKEKGSRIDVVYITERTKKTKGKYQGDYGFSELHIKYDTFKDNYKLGSKLFYEKDAFLKRVKNTKYDSIMARNESFGSYMYKDVLVYIPELNSRLELNYFGLSEEISDEEILKISDSIVQKLN